MVLIEVHGLSFLGDGGEMGLLIRNKDWSKTAIGSPDTWPQSLRTSVSILLNSRFPMFIWWGPEHITIYNDAYRVILGEKHPAALGGSGPKVWSEIWDVVGPLANQVMQQGTSTWAEDQLLYINRLGYVEESYFTFSYSPVFDDAGTVSGVFCACTETTEKVLAAREVQESERNLRNTILQAPVAMCILKGQDFVVEIANERMFEIWGKESRDMLNKPIFEGLPEAKNQGFEQLLTHVYTTGETVCPNEVPATLPRKGKLELVYINFVYEPFRDGNGTITGVMAVAIDVSEQVYSRKKIEENEARTRLAIDSAHLGTFEIDVNKQTIIHSPRVAEIFGLDPAKQWPYQTLIDSAHKDDIEIRNKAHKTAGLTGELFYEMRIVLPDQSIRWIRLNGILINQVKSPCLIGIVLDITEEKKAAEFLEQRIEERTRELKQANDQLKQFTYAASHDLQEPLRKISFFIDRLLTGVGPSINEENKKIADRIQHTTKRMRGLIDDLLDYSNTTLGTMGFEEVDLNTIVHEVLDDMEATINEKEAIIDLDTLPRVKGDPRQLRQLFQNLVSNALKYHKKDEKPHVVIQSKVVKDMDFKRKLPAENSEVAFYEINVSDNGIGFDQADADRIFGLFHRLHGRAEYEGTGVGLAIVQKVVENHHGYIRAVSEPGKGATFNLLLPAE